MGTKIYTRTGDKGETSLFTGERIAKDHPVFDALGAVDECNSAIGAAVSFLPKDPALKPILDQLNIIQHGLFDVGAALATPRTRAADSKLEKTRFDHESIDLLEKWIDGLDAKLPALHSFILPGGHPAGSMLHIARSLCRNAERAVLPISKQADVSSNVLMYLNRLSDYLFVASRFINHTLQIPETLWQPHMQVKN